MKALLFFLTLLTFKISASDDLTAALSEAVADAFAKSAMADRLAKEGVRIGTDLVTSMDFSSLDKDNGQCLATLAKKVAEISTNNPKTTIAIVGLGTTGAFIYKGINYIASIDPNKASGAILMGYGALHVLSDAKYRLQRLLWDVEQEEARVKRAIEREESVAGSSSSSPIFTFSAAPQFNEDQKEKLSILYQLRQNNAQSNIVYISHRK